MKTIILAAALLVIFGCQQPASNRPIVTTGSKSSAPSFQSSSPDIVVDHRANRAWQKKDGGTMPWEQAQRYCRDLVLAGSDDWRLPRSSELDRAYQIRDDFEPPVEGSYWTSRRRKGEAKAETVSFDFGMRGYRRISYPGYVRCVRTLE